LDAKRELAHAGPGVWALAGWLFAGASCTMAACACGKPLDPNHEGFCGIVYKGSIIGIPISSAGGRE